MSVPLLPFLLALSSRLSLSSTVYHDPSPTGGVYNDFSLARWWDDTGSEVRTAEPNVHSMESLSCFSTSKKAPAIDRSSARVENPLLSPGTQHSCPGRARVRKKLGEPEKLRCQSRSLLSLRPRIAGPSFGRQKSLGNPAENCGSWMRRSLRLKDSSPMTFIVSGRYCDSLLGTSRIDAFGGVRKEGKAIPVKEYSDGGVQC